MEIKTAIQKAIEGGYNIKVWHERDSVCEVIPDGSDWGIGQVPILSILLDPLFWKFFGKYLCEKKCDGTNCKLWIMYWHRLIDHLASGKDVESFFAELK